MTWFKVDDQFPRHPKVLRAGTDAAWLFVAGGCYCAQYLTDGRIPKDALMGLTQLRNPVKLAARLVEVGLWHDHGAEWEVHDYLVYNPSREHVEAERRKAAERRAKGTRASRERRATDARRTPAPVPDPSPTSISDAKRPTRAERDAIFSVLIEVFGPASTRARQSFYGETVTDLLKVPGITADEVRLRGRNLQAKDWHDATPKALVKHWDTLGGTNGSRTDFDALAAQA